LRGGTGETFDWTLLAARRSKVPLILSGGLNADNVAEAIAVAHPYAVDTASGTEGAPGRKDPQKLRAFFLATAERGRADGRASREGQSTTGSVAAHAIPAARSGPQV
jgi:phosphoribosylanthranilate isomerase